MSELVKTNQKEISARWQLLATASAVALLGASCSLSEVQAAADSDRPTVWIELGGQLSRLGDSQETFAPDFPVSRPSIFNPSQKFERSPLYSIDESGKLSFEPRGMDWVFSASVRYGRSVAKRDVRQQTSPGPAFKTKSGSVLASARPSYPTASRFAETIAQTKESHLILDFQVGKDVGLGIFGNSRGSSVVNFGVRFAQFSAKSNVAIKSDPDWHFSNKYFNGVKIPKYQTYHTNQANLQAVRNFHGIGPSLSWNASAPLRGTSQESELTLDWGVNASVLFGRQRAQVHHDAQAQYHPHHNRTAGYRIITYSPTPVTVTRSRSVTVPNVGGFAGLSFRYVNAKISAGYRADFFFGAMDGGIDTRKSYDRNFYGPFATISIGLGG